jgi:hypothetical protein
MSLGFIYLYIAGRHFPWFNGYINFAAFFSVPWGKVALASMFTVAMGGGIFVTPLYTVFQTECKQEILARGIAVMNIFNSFFMVAAALFTALLFYFEVEVKEIFFILAMLNTVILVVLKQLGARASRLHDFSETR